MKRGGIIGVFTGNETKFVLKKHNDTEFGQVLQTFRVLNLKSYDKICTFQQENHPAHKLKIVRRKSVRVTGMTKI